MNNTGHPAPWEAAREGRARKSFGSEWKQGELWPLSGSPWRLLLCCSCTPRQLSLILPLFFCSALFSLRTIATEFFKQMIISLLHFAESPCKMCPSQNQAGDNFSSFIFAHWVFHLPPLFQNMHTLSICGILRRHTKALNIQTHTPFLKQVTPL